MRDLELKAEVIQISMYLDIVLILLKKHIAISVNKILLFAYLVKKEQFRPRGIYSAHNTQDVVCKAISLLTGEYTEYCENTKFVLKAIHILIGKNIITLDDGILRLAKGVEVKRSIYEESPFLGKAIELSKKMSERQFMKEVIANV